MDDFPELSESAKTYNELMALSEATKCEIRVLKDLENFNVQTRSAEEWFALWTQLKKIAPHLILTLETVLEGIPNAAKVVANEAVHAHINAVLLAEDE